MNDAYDIIKKARDLLAAIPERELKKATKLDYMSKMNRMSAANGVGQSFAMLIQEALNTTRNSTWQANRAAIIFGTVSKLRQTVNSREKMQREMKAFSAAGGKPDETEWRKDVYTIQWLIDGLQLVRDAKLPTVRREHRHSKRQDLRGLPDDWRQRVIARMPKYYDQALVCAVTGCRPAELVSGIDLVIDRHTGDLIAWIKGAKETEKSGQPWRRMYWPVNSNSPLVRSLAELVAKHPAGSTVRVIVHNAKAFSGAMRAAGKREWPKRKSTITPYCMRHQAAADMKAAGSMSSDGISAALGHVSDVTKSTYGHANMGRKVGRVVPSRVEAARPVQTKAPSKAAAKRVWKSAELDSPDLGSSLGMSM